MVHSTTMVESINSRLRKATRNRGHFPSEQAALKDANHVASGGTQPS
ncbi:transposase [Streptomyces vinaceus]